MNSNTSFKMAQNIEHISIRLIETALMHFFKNGKIKVTDLKCAPALTIGENYTSNILRIVTTYKCEVEEKTISLILKFPPQDEVVLKYVNDMKLFETEIEMFTVIFPAIMNILGNKELSAKCIYSIMSEEVLIMLEDLTPLNFVVCDRQKGLDLDHCLLVVEKLAQLHAGSAILHNRDPQLLLKFSDSIYRNTEFTRGWIKTGFAALIKVTAEWEGYEKYSIKLKSLQETAFEDAIASSRSSNTFNVLNHGDAWTNNFMFLYSSDGKPTDLRFVDLQTCVYSSPILDFLYFWTTSPAVEIRAHHFQTIFSHYYSTLVNTLEKLNYKDIIPSETQFMDDLKLRVAYGLTAAITVLPIVSAPKRNDADFKGLLRDDTENGFQQDAYSCECYKKHIQFLLPFFEELGVFG